MYRKFLLGIFIFIFAFLGAIISIFTFSKRFRLKKLEQIEDEKNSALEEEARKGKEEKEMTNFRF